MRAAARHAHVLTVAWDPPVIDRARLDAWHAHAEGRPVLIEARGVALADPRQPAPAGAALEAADRGAAFGRLVAGMADVPWIVGVHLAALADAPVWGAPRGEADLLGLVDVTDGPHDDLVGALRRVGPGLPGRHAAAR